MLDNVITLPIDELNNATLVNYAFTRFDESQNKTSYIGEDHTSIARDVMTVYRTLPKTNGNFKGVRKTAVKFTKDFSVLGVDGVSSLTAPSIIEVTFSIPVGISDADVLVERQKVIAMLDLDAIMDRLNLVQEV